MGKIKKIIENELIGGTQSTDIYPVTSTKAVYDEDNENLDSILKRRGTINVSTNYNSTHIAETLTLKQAIDKVPLKDRVLGFTMTFLSSDGWKTYQFTGTSTNNWTNANNWIRLVDDKQLNSNQESIIKKLDNKVNTSDVVQQTGNSTTSVMSQKAVFKALYNDKAPTDSVDANQYIAYLKLSPYTNIVASSESLYYLQFEVNDEGNIFLIRFWNGVDFTYNIFSGNAPAEELNYKVFSSLYFTVVLRNLEKLGTKKRSLLIPINYVTNTVQDDSIAITGKNSEYRIYYPNGGIKGNIKIDVIESDLEYFELEFGKTPIIGPNYPTLFLKDWNLRGLIFPFTSENQKIKFNISTFTDVEYKEYLSKLIVDVKNFNTSIHAIKLRKLPTSDNTISCQVSLFDKAGNRMSINSSHINEEGFATISFLTPKDPTIVVNANLLPLSRQNSNYLELKVNVKDWPYELRAKIKDDEEDLRNIGYFPSNVLQQNYYDDNLTEKKGQFLRTDTIIVNQGNIGSLYNQRYYGFKVIGDDTCNIEYKYFTWSTVQKEQGIYDFSGIEQFLKDNYAHHNRSALRLFPSCFQESTSLIYNGKKINFPKYIAGIMASENAQFVEYNGYWLLDINNERVYTEYSKLLKAFGEWLDTVIIDKEKNIKAKDVILYIDFGLLGPWGEGGWYDLQMTTTVEKLVRYVKDFASSVPDIQINIGISLSNEEKYWERNKFVIQSKELKNNAGYIGMFIDNYGSALPIIFKPNIKVSERYTMRSLIKKYVQRGDFFTGEFASWEEGRGWWNGNNFLNTYNSFTLFRQPYIRMHNMTVATAKGAYLIKNISPQTYYVLNNVLSCVGFRYVLSILNTKVGSTSVSIEWELTNIGLNKCFFNIYELYYRVHKTDGTVTDTKIDYDLRTLEPWNDTPLLFAIGNGKYFNVEIPITNETKDVSLIIKDVKGIQSPLYLSNYGRLEDGSYVLWKK